MPSPPVVPVRRIGEAGDAIVAFDNRDRMDRNLRVEYDDCASFERCIVTQRQCHAFMYA